MTSNLTRLGVWHRVDHVDRFTSYKRYRVSSGAPYLETAGNWERQRQPAPRVVGVAPRAIAAAIDAIASGLLIGLPLALFAGDKTTTVDGTSSTTYWTLDARGFWAWVVLTLGYFIAFEAFFGGTIGKAVLGLRVRYRDGDPIDFSASFVRNVLRLVDCFPFVLPYLLGALSIWAGNERQRLGDRLAKTIVTWR